MVLFFQKIYAKIVLLLLVVQQEMYIDVMEDLYNLSIRARVAYGTMCLEALLSKLGYELEEWDFILRRLWEYTSIKYLDDWHDMMAEYIPSSILDCPFEEGDYIKKEEYDFLSKLYRVKRELCEVIELIFYVGTIELYSKVIKVGESMKHLEKIISIMNNNEMPLPEIGKLKDYSFSNKQGWGEIFEREEIM